MNTLCKLYGYTAAAVLALALPAAAQPVKTPQAPPGVAYSQPTPYRTHTVEIKLAASEQEGSDIEYKVAMKPGAALVYTWSAPDAPAAELWSDFHGHTLQDRKTMTVLAYRQEMTNAANGSFTAPFEGVHGWYLQNQSLKPVTVKLIVSGFYDLIPPGQVGNEGRILPQ
jgi:hypothetical protein